MSFRAWLLSTTSLAFATAAPMATFAADKGYAPDFSIAGPAVSAVNGKLGAFGGSIADRGAYGIFGALSVPLGHSFGAQIDGLVGDAGGSFYGIAGHFFWRDPSRGLIGAYASYLGWNLASTTASGVLVNGLQDVGGAEVGKVGAEAEAYLGRVSLEGLLAWQFGTATGVAGTATVAFYPTDSLRLDLGVRHLAGLGTAGSAGIEWAPSESHGLSLFATGTLSSANKWSALGGVKAYFAPTAKSLIRRHREDDPDIELPQNFFETMGGSYCPPSLPLLDGNVCYN